MWDKVKSRPLPELSCEDTSATKPEGKEKAGLPIGLSRRSGGH